LAERHLVNYSSSGSFSSGLRGRSFSHYSIKTLRMIENGGSDTWQSDKDIAVWQDLRNSDLSKNHKPKFIGQMICSFRRATIGSTLAVVR
jgi:hypothetical protein